MKASAIICNVIITLVCAAVIVLSFVFPIIQVSLNYKLSVDDLNGIVNDGISNGEQTDIGDYLHTEDMPTITLGLSISSADVFVGAVEKNAAETVATIIDKNIDGVMEELETPLNEISIHVVKQFARETIKTEIKSEIKNQLADKNISDEEIEEKFESANITDEFLDNQTNRLVDAIMDENSTIETVKQEAVAIKDEFIEHLKNSDDEAFNDVIVENEIVEEAIEKVLTDEKLNLVGENGEIKTDDLLDTLIGILLEYLEGAEQPQSSSAVATLAASTEQDQEIQSNTEKLKAKIRESIVELIPADIADYVWYAFLALAVFLGLSLLPWLYLIIKVLAKLGSANPTIKLKAPIIFGWTPFLFFMAAPMIALALAGSFLPAGLALSIFSSGVYAAIGALALILIWIPYRSIRKQLRKS